MGWCTPSVAYGSTPVIVLAVGGRRIFQPKVAFATRKAYVVQQDLK